MVWLKVEDAVKVMGVMAIDCGLWYYFQGMNDWKTVRYGRNHGADRYFPELQEPYWNPDLALLT